MKSEKQKIIEAKEEFFYAIPEDVYEPCPCGCGESWRYVARGGAAKVAKHEQTFVENYLAKNAPKE